MVKSIFKKGWFTVITLLFLFILLLQIIRLLYHGIEDNKMQFDRYKAMKGKSVYHIWDDTSEELDRQFTDDENHKKYQGDFFSYLYDEGVKFVTDYTYIYNPTIAAVNRVFVSDLFFEFNNISLLKGRFFDASEYEAKTDVIPVIVGYDKKDEYDIGDTVDEDLGSSENVVYKVVGILAKDSTFTNSCGQYEEIRLDDTYIIPVTKDELIHGSSEGIEMAFGRVIMFLDKEDIPKIEAELNKIPYLDLRVVAYADNIAENYEIHGNLWVLIIAVSVIIILAMSIIYAIMIAKFIRSNSKEIGVRLMVGESKFGLVKTFAIVLGLIEVVSVLLLYAVSLSNEALLVYLVVALVTWFVMMVYPTWFIMRHTIAGFLDVNRREG